MQVKDQVQMLLVQDLLDTLSKNMDILPYRFEGVQEGPMGFVGDFGKFGRKQTKQRHNSKLV